VRGAAHVRDWHHRQLKSGGTLEDAAAMTRPPHH
jgi:hypothetical protein